MEGWDSQDVPLERWIALKRLQQRGQAYRRGAPWLAAIVLTALGMLIGLSLISPSWLGEMRLSSLYLALADGFFAIGMGGIFLALWLGTMLMIDLHRLRNWR